MNLVDLIKKSDENFNLQILSETLIADNIRRLLLKINLNKSTQRSFSG